jgi:hypothetical protein
MNKFLREKIVYLSDSFKGENFFLFPYTLLSKGKEKKGSIASRYDRSLDNSLHTTDDYLQSLSDCFYRNDDYHQSLSNCLLPFHNYHSVLSTVLGHVITISGLSTVIRCLIIIIFNRKTVGYSLHRIIQTNF